MSGFAADGGEQGLEQARWSDVAKPAIQQAEECAHATAAELMFFRGAPLAHVVAYCDHLRLANIHRRNMELSRRVARQRPIFSGCGDGAA